MFVLSLSFRQKRVIKDVLSLFKGELIEKIVELQKLKGVI